MPPETYWYWTTSHPDAVPPAPSLAEILIVVLVPIAVLVAVSLGLVLWDRRVRGLHTHVEPEPADLTGAERRALAQIERQLRASDPELVRLLTVGHAVAIARGE